MILQALTKYYDDLSRREPDAIPRPGWCDRRVIAKLELDAQGNLVNIIPAPEKRGWKMAVPNQVKRASNIAANLLCDTSAYLLGMSAKGRPERIAECFQASKERHLSCLKAVDDLGAQAVCRFFERWDPEVEQDNQLIAENTERVLAGGNLVFSLYEKNVLDDEAVRARVNELAFETDGDATVMTCLVSGKKEPIARLHPAIKGIAGAQSTGASIVSFNERAFESYGRYKGQGLNSPVGISSTFAYTTALNYLITQDTHRIRLGDTTIVYWAEKNDDICSQAMTLAIDSGLGGRNRRKKEQGSQEDIDLKLDALMATVRRGNMPGNVDFSTPFYILGLAPNAGRLAIRFFLASTFGDVMTNLAKHYERIDIVHAPYEREYLTPYQLLRETENPNATQKAASSILGGALMRAILSNDRYPESLFTNVLLRVHASQNDEERHTRKITRGRAAIIKAYLIKNCGKSEKEVTVALNEEKRIPAYLLGRIFSILEAVQDATNPGVNANIVDKYFDSASTTPAVVFPVIIKLANHHLSKLERDRPKLAVYFKQQLGSLIDDLPEFPKRLSVEDQGEFILGYFQQTQSRYTKKEEGVA